MAHFGSSWPSRRPASPEARLAGPRAVKDLAHELGCRPRAGTVEVPQNPDGIGAAPKPSGRAKCDRDPSACGSPDVSQSDPGMEGRSSAVDYAGVAAIASLCNTARTLLAV